MPNFEQKITFSGKVYYRNVQPYKIIYKDKSSIIDLPGYYSLDGDAIYMGEDLLFLEKAQMELKND